MHKNERVRFEVRACVTKKVQMGNWNQGGCKRKRAARIPSVGANRLGPAILQPAGQSIGMFDCIKKHLFMIAEYHNQRTDLGQSDHLVDHPARTGATIDGISKLDNGVLGMRIQLLKQRHERCRAAVDISYRNRLCTQIEIPTLPLHATFATQPGPIQYSIDRRDPCD